MSQQLSLFDEVFTSPAALNPVPDYFEKTDVAQAIEVQVKPAREFFSIDESVLEGLDTSEAKIQANLLAIETLKTLSHASVATPEQKRVMARYTGWGGLSKVFVPYGNIHPAQQKLKALLSEQEYLQAEESVLTAYYTETHIVQSMWGMLEALGFKGGRVLEPSCGAGVFIGAMPKALRQESSVVMVDIDSVTSNIAHHLYADEATIVHSGGIETMGFQGEFDVVVGNVPFGNYRVHDERLNQYKLNIHDYFLAKSLDMVRPGGLVALITSSTTLDTAGKDAFRERIEMQAEIKLCVRLPEGAFERLGGTGVVTDIIVLQKRARPIEIDSKGCITQTVEPPQCLMHESMYTGAGETVNGYYGSHPENFLGRLANGRNRWGETLTVKPLNDWESQLADAHKRLEPSFDPDMNVGLDYSARRKTDPRQVKSFVSCGYFFAEDGQLMMVDERNQVTSVSHLPPATVMRLSGMTRIRDLALQLLEMDSRQSESACSVRQDLNIQYDEFMSKYGCLMTPVNRRLFRKDSHAPLLWSLEKWDEENEAALKAEIFERSTVCGATLKTSADTLEEAIALSYNHEGRFDLSFIVKALNGQSEQEVVEQLLAQERVFKDPKTGRWVDALDYLSGKVRLKLKEAVEASKSNPEFDVNVQALKKVVPVNIPIEDIKIRLGVPWIESRFVKEWLLETFGLNADYVDVFHHKETGSWSVLSQLYKNDTRFTTEWGTSRKSFWTILDDLLHQKTTEVFDRVTSDNKEKLVINRDETIAAQERAERIQKSFVDSMMGNDKRKADLETIYNDTYNGVVNRVYDGSHMVIPGLNPAIQLRDAQKDSIWRGIVSGNVLYALAVGGGKTLIQICLAQESKRLGLANKPVLVVPNHMLEAFASEYLRAFPRAKVLAASKEDMDGESRGALLMKMALNDWDAVIMTHSTFGKIDAGDEAVKDMIFEAKAQARAATMGVSDNNLVREAQRSAKMVESKLEGLMSSDKDKGLPSFDKLGIDMVLVDEADLFKNLFFFTRKKRIPGINSAVSQRALGLFIKSRIVFKHRGENNRGLVFSTATPISNTIGEMFIMQKYLQEDRLCELGIDQFDAWSANFAREVTCVEVKPEGSGYRLHTRFAQFVNVPELMLIFKEVAEIRTKKQLALPEPKLFGDAHEIIAVEASEEQKLFVESLVSRAEKIRQGEVTPKEDNMLCVTNDGRKAALDMRCVMDDLELTQPNKVDACINKVFELWDQHHQKRATQLVFCDLSVPGSGFSVYDYIRYSLIVKGVPPEQIAFAQDYKTDKQKAKLHAMVRAGKIRILIGSTELMGFGTNVQDRLIAEHHLDAPWRPRDVEQRDGRIIRQGNMFEVVHIFRYVTSGTFDAYMWQGLERKSRFIAQVMENDGLTRCIEDLSTQALSYAEVKALASGNPLVIEKAGVDAEVAKLSALKSVFITSRQHAKMKLLYAEDHLVSLNGNKAKILQMREQINASDEVKVNGKPVNDLNEGCKAITKLHTLARASKTTSRDIHHLFQIGQLEVNHVNSYMVNGVILMPADGTPLTGIKINFEYGAENAKLYISQKRWSQDLASHLEKVNESIAKAQESIKAFSELIEKPFEFESELNDAIERKMYIDSQLEVDVDDTSALAMAEEA